MDLGCIEFLHNGWSKGKHTNEELKKGQYFLVVSFK
jgi:hypothetical protein